MADSGKPVLIFIVGNKNKAEPFSIYNMLARESPQPP